MQFESGITNVALIEFERCRVEGNYVCNIVGTLLPVIHSHNSDIAVLTN